jgi:uncharacterized protein (TIGR02246 family)
MRKMVVLSALLAASCAHVSDHAEQTVKDIGVIEHVREDWATDWNSKRLPDIMRLYAPDAVFLQPYSARVTGTDAIRALFDSQLATNTPHIAFHGITIEGSDNLAYDSGTYDETVTTGGVTRAYRGDYLLILKRQADGRWLIVHQAWTDAGSSDKRP